METSSLNLGSQIAAATMNLVQDQQKLQGQAMVALIEGAAVQSSSAATSASSSIGVNVDVKV